MKSRFFGVGVFCVMSALSIGLSGCASTESLRPEQQSDFSSIESAAEEGDASAQNKLGLLYLQSDRHDYEEAAYWFTKAAEQDQPEAQVNLGKLYATGKGVNRDMAEASKWYQRAAEQHSAPGQTALGKLYLKGDGVPKNYNTAMTYLLEAAAKGHAPAQYQLGMLYDNSGEFEPNPVVAYKWFTLAAGQGHKAALRARQNLERKLTYEQISQAQRQAAAFAPQF